MHRRYIILYGLLVSLFAILTTPSKAQTDADHSPSDFFESRIRPVLVESCYKCHSHKAEKLKANLTLDSKAGWQKGGDSGPAIIPFHPEKSLLLKAIRHDKGLEPMPPKATLSARTVKDFEHWIKQGAFDPRTTQTLKKPDNDFDLNARKQWWSLYKITDPKPPSVKSSKWIKNNIDAFILKKLEENNLSPTHHADKTTLIRRAAFLLTGLPPAPADVQTFLADKNPDAYNRLIDKLLASEAFGERWARHWLDLVRYAETRGHEFDLGFPNPWRYRDYLIRAFNHDVPYDQFLTEHLAGDLIETPRLNPVDQSNESVIGPGFLNLGSRVHAPTDIREEEIVIIDNQIDIVSKTFQALTVSCARCHDHKFDAITTKDYYSWYGIFSSSRYSYHNINAPKSQKSLLQKLIHQKQAVQDQFKQTAPDSNTSYNRYLSIAVHTIQNFPSKEYTTETVKAVARKNQLAEPLLSNWIHYLAATNNKDKSLKIRNLHFLFAKDDDHKRREFAKLKKQTQAQLPDDAIIMGDFLAERPQWFATGLAFTDSPNKIGELCLQKNPDFPAKRIVLSPVSSAVHSSKFAGCLQSKTFVIERNKIFFKARGRHSRVRVIVNNYQVTNRGPLCENGRLVNSDSPNWIQIDVSKFIGHRAYLEILHDGQALAHQNNGNTLNPNPDAWIEVELAIQSNNTPPSSSYPWLEDLEADNFADHLNQRIQNALNRFQQNRLSLPDAQLLDELIRNNLLAEFQATPAITKLVQNYHDLEKQVPAPAYALSMNNGNGLDEAVFIRGKHQNPSKHSDGSIDYVPRHYLDALNNTPFNTTGSGRLELARIMLRKDNPLTSRVIANRIWHHLMGKGIVSTVDNFGHLGAKPTHPELLDHLAVTFQKNNWSTKAMIKYIMMSNTFRMASQPSAHARAIDPLNNLYQHANIRRLEAEAIRDAMLKISQTLNPKMYGKSIPVHLTEFMKGRGRPRQGPLDGDKRRSIYIAVNRNFLDPMMLTFDRPQPVNPFGRRNVTNVPAQSLILLNNPLVNQLANAWAQNLIKSSPNIDDRIQTLYQQAYAREPLPEELKTAHTTLADLAKSHAIPSKNIISDLQLWSDLCHIHFNTKEFIYLF